MSNAILLINSPVNGDVKIQNTSQLCSGISTAILPINTSYVFGIRPSVSGTLRALVNATTTNLSLLDSNGNVIVSTFNSIALANVATVTMGNQYYVNVSTAAVTVAAATTFFSLQMQTTFSVSNYFRDGFKTVQPYIPGITSSYDSFGQLTWTFTNVSLTAGQTAGLTLGFSGIAIQGGTLSQTSSDTTVFPTVTSDNFLANTAFQFSFQALKTTVFTGTITVTVANVGTSVNLNTLGTQRAADQQEALFRPFEMDLTKTNDSRREIKRCPGSPEIETVVEDDRESIAD